MHVSCDWNAGLFWFEGLNLLVRVTGWSAALCDPFKGNAAVWKRRVPCAGRLKLFERLAQYVISDIYISVSYVAFLPETYKMGFFIFETKSHLFFTSLFICVSSFSLQSFSFTFFWSVMTSDSLRSLCYCSLNIGTNSSAKSRQFVVY